MKNARKGKTLRKVDDGPGESGSQGIDDNAATDDQSLSSDAAQEVEEPDDLDFGDDDFDFDDPEDG